MKLTIALLAVLFFSIGCTTDRTEEFITTFSVNLFLKGNIVMVCDQGLARFFDKTGSYYRCYRGRAGKYIEYQKDDVAGYELIS